MSEQQEKIEFTVEELERLQETYGADDPDIKAALELSAAPPAAEPKGDDLEDQPEGAPATVPPTDPSGEEEPPKTTVEPPKDVPVKALHEERRKRQDLAREKQQLEEEIARLKAGQGATPPQAAQTQRPTNDVLSLSPGKVAQQLFAKEQGREPDVYNSDDLVRLQELTSYVTVKQLEAGQMQQRVQAERETFNRDVLSWRDEMIASPDLEAQSMSRFEAMSDGVQKRMLRIAWDNLIDGRATRDEFDLIREFNEETRKSMTAAPPATTTHGGSAGVKAAMGQPGTADVAVSGGSKTDDFRALIEAKLDRGERLTDEENKYVKNLE